MTIEEYQGLAMRTSPEGHDRVLNGVLGLVGESGELVDTVKKWMFQSGENAAIPREQMLEECGDILWYCAELSTGLERKIDFKYCEDNLFEAACRDTESVPAWEWACTIARAGTDAASLYGKLHQEGDGAEGQIRPEFASLLWQYASGTAFLVNEFLRGYCGHTLDDAMECNIGKLRRRYPDGFDPQRSLHRQPEKA